MDISQLRNICQKEKLERNTGLTLMNRKVSIHFTKMMIACNVTANQVSIGGLALGIVGSCFFMLGIFEFNLIGVLLLYLSLLCDQVDGELARYYKTVNLNGVYIDEFRHIIIYSITIFCLSIPEAAKFDSFLPCFFGFIGAMVQVLARVESKMSYAIFTEKILMEDHFIGGGLNGSGSFAFSSATMGTDDTSRGKISGCVANIFYKAFHYLSHQVWILIWLFIVTLLDHYFLNTISTPGAVSSQGLLFWAYSVYGPLVLLKIVIGHFKENKVEKDCSLFYSKMKPQ